MFIVMGSEFIFVVFGFYLYFWFLDLLWVCWEVVFFGV